MNADNLPKAFIVEPVIEYRQARTPEYYEAEEDAELRHFELTGEEDQRLLPEQVVPFLVAALEKAGYTAGPPPEVAFDIPDDDRRAGCVEDDVIHLHPKLLRQWLLLHELAHSIDPRFGHNGRWAFVYARLVTAVIGDLAGDLLREAFRERDLPCQWEDDDEAKRILTEMTGLLADLPAVPPELT